MFDDEAIARLKLAAEEVAWLTGRGYRSTSWASSSRSITRSQTRIARRSRAARAPSRSTGGALRASSRPTTWPSVRWRSTRSTRSRPSRARSRGATCCRPSTGRSARSGSIARATRRRAQADVAIERLLAAAKELRPSLIKVYIDEGATGASELSSRFTAVAKAQKAKIEIALVPDVPKALRKERQIVTGDADTLDACAGWLNLVGHVVEAVPGAKIVRLQ